jgi:hypothetical protein
MSVLLMRNITLVNVLTNVGKQSLQTGKSLFWGEGVIASLQYGLRDDIMKNTVQMLYGLEGPR